MGKASACNAGDLGSIPGSGKFPGEGNGNSLQYSCLENPMDGDDSYSHSGFGMLFENQIIYLFFKATSIVQLVFLSVNLNGNILICKGTDTFLQSSLQYTNVLPGNDLSS